MMNIKESWVKLKSSKPACVLKTVLESKYFPFITMAVILFGYYMGLDLLNFYYIGISMLLMMLLCDDTTPIIGVFLFMNIMVSRQNSPTKTINSSEYIYQPAIFSQIVIICCVLIIGVIVRIAFAVARKQLKITPIFIGLLALTAALLLNGLFAEGYSYTYLVYALCVAATFTVIYMFGACSIKPTQETFIKIAYAFIAMSIAMIIELSVAYATYENIIVDGVINRGRLTYGWGVYNTMGMLLTISLPAPFYLATKYKYGWLFTIYALIEFLACWFCMSRQAMLGSSIIFILCLVYLFVYAKNKVVHISIVSAFGLGLIIYLSVAWNHVSVMFSSILNALSTGSGRTVLYQEALDNFAKYPIFGIGFYLPQVTDYVGSNIMPLMYHDTLLQFLGACGAVGLFAYGVHRSQTVISYVKNITVERTYIALTILALLLVSLFDNHLFYIFPTLTYSMIVAVMVNSEKLKA
jgi:O-antigen ligase